MQPMEQERPKAPAPQERREGLLSRAMRWHFFPHLLVVLLILFAAIAVALGFKTVFTTDGKTTHLGFEDMGELATQTAYSTEVEVLEDSRQLFGHTIPFTQSKYIYSYDVVIKAGMDFTAVTWSEQDGTIRVRLPEMKILSSALDLDSFKVYHEDESIFQQITLEENNAAMAQLQARAEADAVANGLLEAARDNAETILTGFFASQYDLTEYDLRFLDQ